MKKRTLNKLFSISLTAAMALGMLSGCGNTASNTGTASPAETGTATTESTDTASSGDKTSISIYRASFNQATVASDEVKKVQDAINDYIADKINVEITITDIASGEYGDKANLALSNNEVNLLWTASWNGSLATDNLYAQNAVYDITDLVKDTTLYKAMPEAVWEASSYDNKTYFIPIYKESAEGCDLVVPQRLIDAHNWDISKIKELKDIEPMLADCKADGLKYPLLTQGMDFFYLYYIDKYDFFSKNSLWAVERATDTVVNVVQTSDYADFVKMMCKWGALGYINDEEVTKSTPANAIMTQDWGFAAWADVPDNSAATSTYAQECAVIPITQTWSHSNSTLGSCYAITSNSTEEQAKACIDFLGLLYTDTTLADLFTYGIEGTDYDLVDGRISPKGDLYSHSPWESTSVEATSLIIDEPENKVQLYKDFNEKSNSSCASGFRFNQSPVEAQIAACNNVYNEYGYVLEQGGYSESDVDQALVDYQNALDEAGYQDILSELQSQYEAWKATK